MGGSIKKIGIMIDVPEADSGAGQCAIAASLIFSPKILQDRPNASACPVLFMVPGAGYSRHYYDMLPGGDASYSQARFHAERGAVVAMLDYAGAGDSKIENDEVLDFHIMAKIHDYAVRVLKSTLENGLAHPDIPALGTCRTIGVGQSLGGIITVITQARHRTFQAIAILGASAVETKMPQRPGSDAGDEVDWTYAFHSDETPSEIVAMDLGSGYPLRSAVPEFGTNNIPACTFELFSRPDYLSPYAAEISAPLFLGYGNRDTSGNPRKEPSAYCKVVDFNLCIVPAMAHMHNFAPTRSSMWRKLQVWIDNLDI